MKKSDPFTDATTMPWGKHKDTPMRDVPASYLLWLYEQPWIQEWKGLYDYLKQNEDLLLSEKRDLNEGIGEDGFTSYQDYRDYRGF